MNTFNRVMDELDDHENSKQLRTMLINYERNKSWVDDILYEKIEDLALCPCIVDTDTNNCSVVSRATLPRCGLTERDVIAPAKADTAKHFSLENLTSVLSKLCTTLETEGLDVDDDSIPSEPAPLWVLTTDDNFYGAALMGDSSMLKRVWNEFEEDFYILPSSIYEVLVLPKSKAEDMSTEDLKGMVQQINKTEVDEREQLSDNVYYFDGENLTLAK